MQWIKALHKGMHAEEYTTTHEWTLLPLHWLYRYSLCSSLFHLVHSSSMMQSFLMILWLLWDVQRTWLWNGEHHPVHSVGTTYWHIVHLVGWQTTPQWLLVPHTTSLGCSPSQTTWWLSEQTIPLLWSLVPPWVECLPPCLRCLLFLLERRRPLSLYLKFRLGEVE